MAEFGVAASLEATIDQRSLKQARKEIEDELDGYTIGVGVNQPSKAIGERASKERAMSRQLLSQQTSLLQKIESTDDELLDLAEERNVYLSEFVENTTSDDDSGGLKLPGGGGDGGFGPILGGGLLANFLLDSSPIGGSGGALGGLLGGKSGGTFGGFPAPSIMFKDEIAKMLKNDTKAAGIPMATTGGFGGAEFGKKLSDMLKIKLPKELPKLQVEKFTKMIGVEDFTDSISVEDFPTEIGVEDFPTTLSIQKPSWLDVLIKGPAQADWSRQSRPNYTVSHPGESQSGRISRPNYIVRHPATRQQGSYNPRDSLHRRMTSMDQYSANAARERQNNQPIKFDVSQELRLDPSGMREFERKMDKFKSDVLDEVRQKFNLGL